MASPPPPATSDPPPILQYSSSALFLLFPCSAAAAGGDTNQDKVEEQWKRYEEMTSGDGIWKIQGRIEPIENDPYVERFYCFFGGIPVDGGSKFVSYAVLSQPGLNYDFIMGADPGKDYCFINFASDKARTDAIEKLHTKVFLGSKLFLCRAPGWQSPPPPTIVWDPETESESSDEEDNMDGLIENPADTVYSKDRKRKTPPRDEVLERTDGLCSTADKKLCSATDKKVSVEEYPEVKMEET